MDKTEAREASEAMTAVVRARLELSAAAKAEIPYFQQEDEAALDARTLSRANPLAADRQARDSLAFEVALDPQRRAGVLADIQAQRGRPDNQPLTLPTVRASTSRDLNEPGPYADTSTQALRLTANGLDRFAADRQPQVLEEVELELMRRQYQVARGERPAVELVAAPADRDRTASAALLSAAGIDPANNQRQAARASVEVVARQELEAEYVREFGTPVGARTFAARVIDRISERIEQDPTLAAVRLELQSRQNVSAQGGSVAPPPRRDPALERETTATIEAAELVAAARDQRDPSPENRVRALVLEAELAARRIEPGAPDRQPSISAGANGQPRDLQAGSELLTKLDQQQSKGPTQGLDRDDDKER